MRRCFFRTLILPLALLVPPGLSGGQLPGDCDQDGTMNIADPVCILTTLFGAGGAALPCGEGRIDEPGNIALLDWQPDGAVNIADAIASLRFLFGGGPPHPLMVADEAVACAALAGCGAGSGLQLDGINSRVDIPSLHYGGQYPVTIEAFVCPSTYRTFEAFKAVFANMRGADTGLALGIDSDGFAQATIRGARGRVARGRSPLRLGVRVHLAAVYDLAHIWLFVDGKLQGNPVPATYSISNWAFKAGADPSGTRHSQHNFAGTIEQLRMSRTVRYKNDFVPASELLADADTELLYHFNQIAGLPTAVEDLSGSGHQGLVRDAHWRPPCEPGVDG